ncbi:COV 1-like protein, partial [Tanacetum coccineum]
MENCVLVVTFCSGKAGLTRTFSYPDSFCSFGYASSTFSSRSTFLFSNHQHSYTGAVQATKVAIPLRRPSLSNVTSSYTFPIRTNCSLEKPTNSVWVGVRRALIADVVSSVDSNHWCNAPSRRGSHNTCPDFPSSVSQSSEDMEVVVAKVQWPVFPLAACYPSSDVHFRTSCEVAGFPDTPCGCGYYSYPFLVPSPGVPLLAAPCFLEPSYIFIFVGIRWLGAENSMIHLVNGDFIISLYGFRRSSSCPSLNPPSTPFPFPPLSSSSKDRRMGWIIAPDHSLCCLMRALSEDIAFEMLEAVCQTGCQKKQNPHRKRSKDLEGVMVDEKLPISSRDKDKDRELLIPVANNNVNDKDAPASSSSSSSKPCCSSTSSSNETFVKVVRSWASKKFMTGCVILLPMAITFYITWWFIHFVDGFFSPIYDHLGIDIFGLGFITSITFIFLIGVFMSSWLGAFVLSLGEWFIKRMPFIGHIYNASRQISAAISPDQNTQAFKEVVIISHPRIGEYAFGFITSSVTLQV